MEQYFSAKNTIIGCDDGVSFTLIIAPGAFDYFKSYRFDLAMPAADIYPADFEDPEGAYLIASISTGMNEPHLNEYPSRKAAFEAATEWANNRFTTALRPPG